MRIQTSTTVNSPVSRRDRLAEGGDRPRTGSVTPRSAAPGGRWPSSLLSPATSAIADGSPPPDPLESVTETCFTTTSLSLASTTSSRPERRAPSADARPGWGTTVTPVPVRRPASRTISVIAASWPPTMPTRCGLALCARMAGIVTPAATTSSSTIVLTRKARDRPRCRSSRSATIAVSLSHLEFMRPRR